MNVLVTSAAGANGNGYGACSRLISAGKPLGASAKTIG